MIVNLSKQLDMSNIDHRASLLSQCKDRHSAQSCKHECSVIISPNLSTAFPSRVCGGLKPNAARPTTSPKGGSAVAVTVAKAGQLRRLPRSRALSLRAALEMGAAIKEGARERQREEKGQKYPESRVYNWLRLSAFFMCEHGPAENSRSHLVPRWNPTLSPLGVPSHSVHPSTRLPRAHLTL